MCPALLEIETMKNQARRYAGGVPRPQVSLQLSERAGSVSLNTYPLMREFEWGPPCDVVCYLPPDKAIPAFLIGGTITIADSVQCEVRRF